MTNTKETKNFQFIDDSKNIVKCEAEFDTDLRFSMMGEYCGAIGQIFDDVKPNGFYQNQIIAFWKSHHLKIITQSDWDLFCDWVNTIEREDESRLTQEYLDENIDDDKIKALLLFLELSIEEVEQLKDNIEISGNTYMVGGNDYLVCTDDEADEEIKERLTDDFDSDDGVFCDMFNSDYGKFMKQYFDLDSFIEDRQGERGNELNYFDGSEEEQDYNGETYYIYKR